MKIRTMRWGYDGGGFACGPVEGTSIVEICVTNSLKHNFFVALSRVFGCEHIHISPLPVFDLLIQSNHYDVDFDAEYEKVVAHVIEEYDYEIGDEPEEMQNSAFAKVIHLARLAMQEYYFQDSKESDAARADAFIEEYLNKDIDTLTLPELQCEDEDEEEYEDSDEDE